MRVLAAAQLLLRARVWQVVMCSAGHDDRQKFFWRVAQGGHARRTSEFYEYRRFVRERATMARQRSSKQLMSPAVDFQRIWSDRDARGATREGISIWRPNPPPGYCSLGEGTLRESCSLLLGA